MCRADRDRHPGEGARDRHGAFQVHDLMVALREAIKAEAQAFNAEAKVKGIKPAPLP